VRGLGQAQVVARIGDIALEEARLAWLRQQLVDTAAGHHVAAQE